MNIQITLNRYRILLTCMVLSLLYGCTLSESLQGPDQLTIDKVPSDKMHILYVDVLHRDGGTYISGKVKFNRGMFGTPSDNLVVTIIDPGGNVLSTVTTHYYWYGKPTREHDKFLFSLTIPQIISNDSTVRLENDES
jgi:hypothetical protein